PRSMSSAASRLSLLGRPPVFATPEVMRSTSATPQMRPWTIWPLPRSCCADWTLLAFANAGAKRAFAAGVVDKRQELISGPSVKTRGSGTRARAQSADHAAGQQAGDRKGGPDRRSRPGPRREE